MEFINSLIGTPLGYLMYFCLGLVNDYGIAILLFTLLTRIILMPLSLLAQKNSIKMVKMTPAITDLQRRHAGNKALIAEEQKKLYKKERYSTFVGILPLLIQLPIILGLIAVIYNPLTHLFHLDPALISAFIGGAVEQTGIPRDSMGVGAELFAMQAIQHNPEAFAGITDSSQAISQIVALDTSFFGLDLLVVPWFTNIELVMAIAAALSALLLCVVQNHYNVLQVNAGFLSRYGMLIFMVAFSGYFALVLPAALGLYWTAANLISIPVLFICNLVYSPKAYMTPELKASHHALTREEKAQKRIADKELNKRSKADSKRFFDSAEPRELVFYSEASGFYKYFKGLITRIISQSDIIVHYLTSDPNDQVFDIQNPQLCCYYLNDKMLISTLMRIDADMVVMTTPDIETYHLKRSLVRKDAEYVFLDHGVGSLNLMLREHSLDHFDTVFCYGPSHFEEVREIEYAYELPQKTLVRTGFELFDELTDKVNTYKAQLHEESGKNGAVCEGADTDASIRPKVLIAPSWQPDNILECCAEELIHSLLDNNMQVTLRPHPEFIKRFPDKIKLIKESFAEAKEEDFFLQENFADNSTLYSSDLVITDWSTIYMEFCYTTKKPALFINTTPKIANPNYGRIPLEPMDILLRDELGTSLDPSEAGEAGEVALSLISKSDYYHEALTELFSGMLYEVGNGMQNGADYIVNRISIQRKNRGAL